MATSILCGERETFGVEYEIAKSPNYIHARLWIGGNWAGDIKDTLMPEYMCARLLELAQPLRYRRFAYDSDEDSPTYQALIDQGGGSFGESFDPFALTYFSVRKTNRIHFKWQLPEVYYPLFPDYPRQEFHGSVSMPYYRVVVTEFVTAMVDKGYYVIRRGMPTPAELDPQRFES